MEIPPERPKPWPIGEDVKIAQWDGLDFEPLKALMDEEGITELSPTSLRGNLTFKYMGVWLSLDPGDYLMVGDNRAGSGKLWRFKD